MDDVKTSQRPDETDQQWLDRIRSYRDDRDELMLRTRAFKCMASDTLHSPKSQAQMEMAAFLELFHPDMPEAKRRVLIKDAE